MEKKKRQESKAKLEEIIKKMRESGLKVTNLADKGIKSIGLIGGVKPPSSVPAQEEEAGEMVADDKCRTTTPMNGTP